MLLGGPSSLLEELALLDADTTEMGKRQISDLTYPKRLFFTAKTLSGYHPLGGAACRSTVYISRAAEV